MSDHQPHPPQHSGPAPHPHEPHEPYPAPAPYAPPQEPYAQPNPYAQPGAYAPQDPYAAPAPHDPRAAAHDPQAAPYGGSYGSPGSHGPHASYGSHDSYGQQQTGSYGQQQAQPYAPHDPYMQQQPQTPQPQQHAQQPQQQPTVWPVAGGQQIQQGQQIQHDQQGQQIQQGQHGQQPGHPGQHRRPGNEQAGYDAYGRPAATGQDAYGSPQPPAHTAPQPGRPESTGHTQTWSALTWETGVQPPLPAVSDAEQTAYLPAPPPTHQQAPHQAPHQTPLPPEKPASRQHPYPPQTGPAAPAGAAAPAASPAPAAAPVSTAHLAPNQRARAEGRSPIIPPGRQPALLTAGLAVLLALTALVGRPLLAVPVVLLQAVTAAGWFRLNGMWPARQGIALAFLAGLTTDIALLAADRDSAPLVAIGTLGVWCLFVLVLQLRNRGSADERMYALTAGLASTALAVLAAGQLAAAPHAVVVGAVAVAVATLARALPLRTAAAVAVALPLAAATGAGAVAGLLTDLGIAGALLGLAAGGCALIGLRVASYDYPSRFVHLTAGVALPLALAAPAVYVLGRALV
ncbi:hypothetical protein [Streptomyces celluloflavus]|uniref:hypothetical protein n=1 Tax=Streptomyces celluloflavus TaxID=58344 RepID=UPI00367BF139